MLMHEWLQFRDKTVRKLTEGQAEEQAEVEAAGATQADLIADDVRAEEAVSPGSARDMASDEFQEDAGPHEEHVIRPSSRTRTSAVSGGAQQPRTARKPTGPAPPKTAREVLESLQPSAEVRARLEAVLARQQRLPLDADTAAETRRPRRAAETREQLVARLLDPTLSLQETALLLGVCPTTVRRYTNRGVMKCFRTPGNQRRFKLSDVLEFMERREHGEV